MTRCSNCGSPIALRQRLQIAIIGAAECENCGSTLKIATITMGLVAAAHIVFGTRIIQSGYPALPTFVVVMTSTIVIGATILPVKTVVEQG